ncbi:MAG: DNA-processing protein DprA [Paludibacteraceae bacterium]|nr:DNA-processing protein DprA [Paludibacteraceae bacterium]
MDEERLYQIALSHLFRWQLRKEHQLLEQYGSASEVWKHIDVDKMTEALQLAEQEITFIEKHGIQTFFYKDDNYPTRLKQCVDAPVLLFGKGNLHFNEGKMVAVVGTRMASDRGKETTRQLVHELGNIVPDVTVISGLAYGIDVAAHRAALEAGLPTIIVPAHGLDRIYPNLHRNVAIQALDKGGILTEYHSGVEPEKMNFVARNRIIAGLADAVVVVESKLKGGSLITAGMAQDYNREVFTFPGRPTDDLSQGCNYLIRNNKAHLIENGYDLAVAMRWETQSQPVQLEIAGDTTPLSPNQQDLLDRIGQEEDGIHVNALVMETQRPYPEVVADLMEMVINGIIKDLPGGIYKAIK